MICIAGWDYAGARQFQGISKQDAFFKLLYFRAVQYHSFFTDPDRSMALSACSITSRGLNRQPINNAKKTAQGEERTV
jgi:hypothetical protein